jgi:DNA-binding transcriptional LysR family regulator
MNEPSSIAPAIDLLELHLLRSVAKHGGITKAAKVASLSQSALTRQIQGIEGRLGFKVFERTTRQFQLTAAGGMLLRETEGMHRILQNALRKVSEDCFGLEKKISLGVSRSLTLAHLPGLLHGHLRRNPEVRIVVSNLPGPSLIEAVAEGRLDVGVLCPPRRLPRSVAITHRITDAFALIVPQKYQIPNFEGSPSHWAAWVSEQAWLQPPPQTRSRVLLEEWWTAQNLIVNPAMELESFDLIVQLVALGLGVACVPRRALSSFPRKQQIQMLPLPIPLVRELAVISASKPALPTHVQRFIRNILFS